MDNVRNDITINFYDMAGVPYALQNLQNDDNNKKIRGTIKIVFFFI